MAIQSSSVYVYALQVASMLWRCIVIVSFTVGIACAAHADENGSCSSAADKQLSDTAKGNSLRELRKLLNSDAAKAALSPACKIDVLKRAFDYNDYDTAALLFGEHLPLGSDVQRALIFAATRQGDPALLELALAHTNPVAADFGKTDATVETPLAVALQQGNTVMLDMLLRADRVHFAESDKQFAYAVKQAACTHENSDALDLLLGFKGNGQSDITRNADLSASLAGGSINLAEKYCSADIDHTPVVANTDKGNDCVSTNNTHRKGKTQYTICHQAPTLLESNNPNLLGYSREKGEQNYIDIGLSLRYPLFFDWSRKGENGNWFPYFGFDMRGAFYIGDRPSSPVIVRSFNPSVHFRRFEPGQQAETARDDLLARYLDVGYGHLSDGQTIDTLTSLQQDAASIKAGYGAGVSQEQALEYARDHISRGWDYAELTWHFADPLQAPNDNWLAYTLGIRRYFSGLLQKHVEEFNPQIDAPRAITMLNQVSGLSLNIFDQLPESLAFVHDVSLNLSTGLLNAGKWNSAKFSVTTRPLFRLDVPLTVWISNGYVNTLSQYYRHQTAMGIAFSFDTE